MTNNNNDFIRDVKFASGINNTNFGFYPYADVCQTMTLTLIFVFTSSRNIRLDNAHVPKFVNTKLKE